MTYELRRRGAWYDMATVKKGSGLTNLVDGLDALGGTMHIPPRSAAGSTLHGSLPVEPAVVGVPA